MIFSNTHIYPYFMLNRFYNGIGRFDEWLVSDRSTCLDRRNINALMNCYTPSFSILHGSFRLNLLEVIYFLSMLPRCNRLNKEAHVFANLNMLHLPAAINSLISSKVFFGIRNKPAFSSTKKSFPKTCCHTFSFQLARSHQSSINNLSPSPTAHGI